MDYETIRRSVEIIYPKTSYKISFYLGLKDIIDNIWIAKHDYSKINVISIYPVENKFKYTVHLGKDNPYYYWFKPLGTAVGFESPNIIGLKEVNQIIRSMAMAIWEKDNK